MNKLVHACTALRLPRGFDVAPAAPDTFADLHQHATLTGRMLVWSGASDATVWQCTRTNWAFRAWHDWHHVDGALPFDASGEAEACHRQCVDVFDLLGDNATTRRLAAILHAEINGQLAYAARHDGAFPRDQIGFVNAYLADAGAALELAW